MHAAHPGREIHHVELAVGGELPGMAVRAQEVGPRHFHGTDGGQPRLGAPLALAGRLAASAGNRPLLWNREPQQLG